MTSVAGNEILALAAVVTVEQWLCVHEFLSESASYWTDLKTTIERGRIAGPRVHDAPVAVLCRLGGVKKLWTADRDFSRFPRLKARNPLVA